MPRSWSVRQESHDRVVLFEEHAFGDLQREYAGVEAVFNKDLVDHFCKVLIVQLAGGHVHAHAELVGIGVAPSPAAQVGAGLVEHPPPQGDYEPGLLGDRDELRREQNAPFRMVPTCQRLNADDPSVAQLDDRLVVHQEFAARDRLLELGSLLHPHEHRLMETGLVEPEGALSRILGGIERQIGFSKEVGGVTVRVRPRRGYSHGRARIHIGVRHGEGSPEDVEHTLRQRSDGIGLRSVEFRTDRELIPT